MRPTYEIQADIDRAWKDANDAIKRAKRLQKEFLEAQLAELQAVPLTEDERALLTRLAQGPIQTDMGETPDPFTDDESELVWKLREKGFAHYYAESWNEGTWTITDEGRKKLASP